MLFIKNFSQLSLVMMITLNCGIAYFYYLFKYDNGITIVNKIDNIREQKKLKEAELKQLQIKLTNLQDVKVASKLLGKKLIHFLQYLPEKTTSSMFINLLNEEARVSGVSLGDIENYNVDKKQKFYERFKVHISVKGLFSQILVFLSRLTHLTQIITVENFTLHSVTQGHRKNINSLNEVVMKMNIYSYRYISHKGKKTEKNQEKK